MNTEHCKKYIEINTKSCKRYIEMNTELCQKTGDHSERNTV